MAFSIFIFGWLSHVATSVQVIFCFPYISQWSIWGGHSCCVWRRHRRSPQWHYRRLSALSLCKTRGLSVRWASRVGMSTIWKCVKSPELKKTTQSWRRNLSKTKKQKQTKQKHTRDHTAGKTHWNNWRLFVASTDEYCSQFCSALVTQSCRA